MKTINIQNSIKQSVIILCHDIICSGERERSERESTIKFKELEYNHEDLYVNITLFIDQSICTCTRDKLL